MAAKKEASGQLAPLDGLNTLQFKLPTADGQPRAHAHFKLVDSRPEIERLPPAILQLIQRRFKGKPPTEGFPDVPADIPDEPISNLDCWQHAAHKFVEDWQAQWVLGNSNRRYYKRVFGSGYMLWLLFACCADVWEEAEAVLASRAPAAGGGGAFETPAARRTRNAGAPTQPTGGQHSTGGMQHNSGGSSGPTTPEQGEQLAGGLQSSLPSLLTLERKRQPSAFSLKREEKAERKQHILVAALGDGFQGLSDKEQVQKLLRELHGLYGKLLWETAVEMADEKGHLQPVKDDVANEVFNCVPAKEKAMMIDDVNNNARRYNEALTNALLSELRMRDYHIRIRPVDGKPAEGLHVRVETVLRQLKEAVHEFDPVCLLIRDEKQKVIANGIAIHDVHGFVLHLLDKEVESRRFDPRGGEAFRLCAKMDGIRCLQDRNVERLVLVPMTGILNGRNPLVQSPYDCHMVAAADVDENWHTMEQVTMFVRAYVHKTHNTLVKTRYGDVRVLFDVGADMKTFWILFGVTGDAGADKRCMCCAGSHKTFTFSDTWEWRVPEKNMFGLPPALHHPDSSHAEPRIVERLLWLELIYCATIDGAQLKFDSTGERTTKNAKLPELKTKNRPLYEAEVRLREVVKVLLNECKVHGVSARKDGRSSGDKLGIISLTGAQARAVVRNRSKIIKAVNNVQPPPPGGKSGRDLSRALWNALADLSPYFTEYDADGVRWEYKNREADAEKLRELLHAFGRAFRAKHGDSNITPYIHLLVDHMAWYWREYGPWVLWCGQGLEKDNCLHKQRENRSNRGGGPLAQGRAGVHMHTLELSYRETLGHMTTRTETISKKRKWAEQKGGGWYVTREQQPAASCLRKKSKLQSSES